MTTDNYDVYWCGDKGIHMKVTTHALMSAPLVVDIKGMGEPLVSYKLNGMDGSDEEWEEAIRHWLDREGYLAIWHEEATAYKQVLSQVELPYRPLEEPKHKVSGLDGGRYLYYELSTGDDDSFYIEMLVEVRTDIVSIHVGLVDGDENGPVYTYMGVSTTTLPLTLDSLKATVNPVVEEFVGRVRALMGQPVLSLY